MKKSSRVRTVDVPQADSLSLIRRVVESVHSGRKRVSTISEDTGFSERHVRYRLEAARILDLLSEDLSLTARGLRLMDTAANSDEEVEGLRRAVQESDVITLLAPGLLTAPAFDLEGTAKRIEKLSGLAYATAERRSKVFRSWRRQISDHRSMKG